MTFNWKTNVDHSTITFSTVVMLLIITFILENFFLILKLRKFSAEGSWCSTRKPSSASP